MISQVLGLGLGLVGHVLDSITGAGIQTQPAGSHPRPHDTNTAREQLISVKIKAPNGDDT